jgi:hypothetical protein
LGRPRDRSRFQRGLNLPIEDVALNPKGSNVQLVTGLAFHSRYHPSVWVASEERRWCGKSDPNHPRYLKHHDEYPMPLSELRGYPVVC